MFTLLYNPVAVVPWIAAVTSTRLSLLLPRLP
jgi:hypothetical protein